MTQSSNEQTGKQSGMYVVRGLVLAIVRFTEDGHESDLAVTLHINEALYPRDHLSEARIDQ
jgi:hypothetical protein